MNVSARVETEAEAGGSVHFSLDVNERLVTDYADTFARFLLASPAVAQAGRALVGRQILYHWPVQGWVLRKVVRVSRVPEFSHVISYALGSALGVGVAASLLDAPSYGSGPATRWVVLFLA